SWMLLLLVMLTTPVMPSIYWPVALIFVPIWMLGSWISGPQKQVTRKPSLPSISIDMPDSFGLILVIRPTMVMLPCSFSVVATLRVVVASDGISLAASRPMVPRMRQAITACAI